MANPHGSFIWYELMTPDPDGAKAFYDAVVGWDIEPKPAGEMDYRMIRRSDGGNAGGVMRLTEEMTSHGARPVWLGYIGVEDVDSALARIVADGGETLMPAWDVPGIGRLAMATDPQGAPFYLMTPTPPAGQESAKSDVFSVDQAQHVRWNELNTSDQQGAVDFYQRHFGWRQEGHFDMGEMGQYQFIYDGDVRIGAVMPKMPQVPQTIWTFYIGVDDIDRAVAAVESAGGKVLNGPHPVPGDDFVINGQDPQGAPFALVGPRKS